MENLQDATSTSQKISKGLFLALLATILYASPFIENFLDPTVNYGFLGAIAFLGTLPAIICLLVPLSLVNKLSKKIIFFLALFTPYWLFITYYAGGGHFELYFPYIAEPFMVLVTAHFILEIVTKEKIVKLMIPVLSIFLVASLIILSVVIIKKNNSATETKVELTKSWDAYGLAVKNSNPQLCEGISIQEHKDSCFNDIGVNLGDSLLCNKIQNKNRKDSCLQNASANYTKRKQCEAMTTQASKDGCLFQIAENSNDPSLCNNFENQPLRSACFSSIAHKYKRFDLCDKISPDETRYACLVDAVIETKDVSLCAKIAETYLNKNACLRLAGQN
jgi:hypothetical protein